MTLKARFAATATAALVFSLPANVSSRWTKIVTGILLFAFIALQQAIIVLARRSATRRAGAMP